MKKLLLFVCLVCLVGMVPRTAHADPRPMIEQASGFESLAVQAAEQWSREQGRPVRVEVLGAWVAAVRLPARYRWSSAMTDQSPGSRVMTVRFVPETAPGSEPGAEVRLRLRDLSPAWVVRTALQVGQPVPCEALEERLVPASAGHGVRWSGACDALTGRQARRPLAQGDILMSSDLRLPPAVSRLSKVLLKAVQGPIEIEVTALALHDADVGQQVPVRPEGALQSVMALVVAPGTAVLK